jgi:hypothetical protein
MITRRTALQGLGAGVAAAALPLPALASPAKPPELQYTFGFREYRTHQDLSIEYVEKRHGTHRQHHNLRIGIGFFSADGKQACLNFLHGVVLPKVLHDTRIEPGPILLEKGGRIQVWSMAAGNQAPTVWTTFRSETDASSTTIMMRTRPLKLTLAELAEHHPLMLKALGWADEIPQGHRLRRLTMENYVG